MTTETPTVTQVEKRFIFSGSAVAFGGHILSPEDKFLKSAAIAHIAATGGLSKSKIHGSDTHAEEFQYKDFIKFGEAYSCAKGEFHDPSEAITYSRSDHQQNPPPTVTTVESHLCDLEINVPANTVENFPKVQFCVKKVEVKMRTVDNPDLAVGIQRLFDASFHGITLKTGEGKAIELIVSTDLQVFADHQTSAAPINKYNDPASQGQISKILHPLGVHLKSVIDNFEGKQIGPMSGTFVSGIDWAGGEKPDGTDITGNQLTIPGLGRIFFGEITMDGSFRRATLLRFELGPDILADVSVCEVRTDGTWMPAHGQ